jgi:cobalt-zinc-cadmium efflux system membrane fusion protein
MSGVLSATALLCVVLVVPACGDERAPAAQASAATPAAEGMCKEHKVLEAVCTKCNPRLIPVFQAKGDWCEEHGFPGSFCPICHPERGGRPPSDVSDDGAPPDGTRVRFKTREAAKLAGIATARAEARPGGARIEVVATMTYDATRRAEINARAAGVVRQLLADVGTKVAAGAPLARIESAAVGADRSRLTAAAARVRVATATHQRERELHARGLAAQKAVLAAEQELAAARAEQAAAAAAVGVLDRGGGSAGTYTLRAPIAGTVIRRNASVGHMVGVEELLFEVVDTSSMWAEMEVPETELSLVAAGQAVTLTVDGLEGESLTGTIAYVAPEIEPKTRTASARVALANPGGRLRANMFARAQISLGKARASVLVPRVAVQRAGPVHLVFVKQAEDLFEARRVQTGLTQGDLVEVTKGIQSGEEVATTGSFLLKTETLKGSIGAGCCDVE